MDYGHYNCRDYHITPHFSPTTIVSERYPIYRHESFDELEQRSRSPASQMPKFPLLDLPLELRQQILTYLLPHTLKKRGARGMVMPSCSRSGSITSGGVPGDVVWKRGNVALFSVCKQLHQECAELVYGKNTFLLRVTYAGIEWRFRWLLPSGLAPSRSYNFLEGLPQRYMALVKRLEIHVDFVDSYTGMIKWNVGGKGYTHGLRRQVQRLVNALREENQGSGQDERKLTKVSVLVSTGSAASDAIASNIAKQKAKVMKHDVEKGLANLGIRNPNNNSGLHPISSQRDSAKLNEDVQQMLEPLAFLPAVSVVTVEGAVNNEFARHLEERMRNAPTIEEFNRLHVVEDEGLALTTFENGIQLCVYGNDLR